MGQPASSTPVQCPLCAQPGSRSVQQLAGAQLADLWRTLGHKFTPDAWGRITADSRVELLQCGACGFEFFDPALAGNGAFYRQLEREGYFSANRPEFVRTGRFLAQQGVRRVLDVGCGSGNFLDVAKAAGCDTAGLELNAAAGHKARAKGHRIFNCLLHELDRDKTGGGFGLITIFQVLEHVPNPVAVMRQAAALLSAGGFIAVAVPAAGGVCDLCPWDPHQWPPHHISRWRLADLDRLGREAQLKLVDRGGDLLLGAEIEHMWRMHNLLAPVLGHKPRWPRNPSMLTLLYRRTGMKYVFPRRGWSVYAYYVKRDA